MPRSRQPIKVEPELNLWDKQVEEYTKLGLTADYISGRTGLSVSQVRYRTRKLNVSSLDYRRGETAEAKLGVLAIDTSLRRITGLRKSITAILRYKKFK